jgi:hypothetical protein
MLKEALVHRDKELQSQKMEIDNHRYRIDELEKMIQSLGNLLYKKQEP